MSYVVLDNTAFGLSKDTLPSMVADTASVVMEAVVVLDPMND